MNEDSLTSKTTGKQLGVKITLIVLILALGAGITLFSCRPDLWNSCKSAVAGALSLDKPAAAAGFTAVATENTDVRSGSGSTYDVVSTVPKGASVELMAKPTSDAQWVQVKTTDGKTGWCLRENLNLNGSQGSSSSETQSSPSSTASSKAPASSASSASSKVSMTVAATQVSLENAAAPLSIQVSIKDQRVTIYDAKGRIVKQFVCSSGSKGSETPTGTFKISERGESFYSPSVNEGGYYWTRFYGEYLFHSVPFDKNYKLEPEEAAKLGTPASHGCIRLAIEDAKWIFVHIPRGTKVTIK